MTKRTFVRKRYWNEPQMGWYEKAYLPEILRGLAITGGVFLRNMAKWMTGKKGALTTYYPEETRWDYARGNRGKHVLVQRPDGSPQCIACNLCATVCPAKVIEIEAAFDPADAAHPKYPAKFEIDYSRCVYLPLRRPERRLWPHMDRGRGTGLLRKGAGRRRVRHGWLSRLRRLWADMSIWTFGHPDAAAAAERRHHGRVLRGRLDRDGDSLGAHRAVNS